MGSGLIYNALG